MNTISKMNQLMKNSKRTRNTLRKILAFSLLLVLNGTIGIALASDQTDVRDAVQRVFEQLKSRDYGALYDVLPSKQRSRMSRDRFINALQRAQDMYSLDRIEIGAIRVSGNLAVVDTVLYGRVVAPIQAEGKIVVQQYLLREDGKWRVATGDQATVKKFIASSLGFRKGFRLTPPRIYVKQDGKWLEFKPPGSRGNRST